MSDQLPAYNKARDSALSSGTLAAVGAMVARWGLILPALTGAQWEVAIHLARTASRGVDPEQRAKSRAWLLARGIGHLGDDPGRTWEDGDCGRAIHDAAMAIIFPMNLEAESETHSFRPGPGGGGR